MAHHQIADGEDSLQLNNINKQRNTAGKECASSLEVGCGSNNLTTTKISLLQKFTLSLEFDQISK
jgi:hypothetical protein